MLKKRLRSGGFVNVLQGEDLPIPGEANFTDKELEFAIKTAKTTHDPEMEKIVWQAIMEKKLSDVNYSVFDDFPIESSGPAPDPTLQSGPSAQDAPEKSTSRKQFKGEHICREILEQLKGTKEPA